MSYFYAGLWILVGLILIFALGKENKIFYLAGAFFLVLGGWWLANALLPKVDLFSGGWGIALRCVTGVCLVIFVFCFAREYWRNKKEAEKKDKGTSD